MSKKITLRPVAKRDLKKIYKDSVQGWGVARADLYIFDLEKTFLSLANNEISPQDADFIKTGLLSYQVVSHVVFLFKTSSGIDVVRILHKSMDHVRHI